MIEKDISLLEPQCPGSHKPYPTIPVTPSWSEMIPSARTKFASPNASVCTLPRSPTCLSNAVGAPWFFPNGLKCAPAERQPPDRSPNSLKTKDHYYGGITKRELRGAYWTWKPCNAFGESPVIFPQTVTNPPLMGCSNVTVPVAGVSPCKTATAYTRYLNNRSNPLKVH